MRTFTKVWLGIGLLAIGFGLVIVLLATFTGGFYHKGEATFSFSDSYENVDDIDINISYGKVEILEGDTFSIEARNLWKEELTSYTEGGTWYISDENNKMVRFFGNRVSLGRLISWNDDYTPIITITLPRDFVANEFYLDVDAGEVKADTIRAKNGNFNVDAGRLVVENLSIKETSQYNVGAGEMILKNLTAQDISLDCGVGRVEITGTLKGKNSVSCGIGKVELDLMGEESDFSYQINSGIGNVSINNNDYHNVAKHIQNDTDNFLELDCGIGNITVDFN